MAFTQPVSIAIVGTGLIGPRHAQAVVGDPDAVLSCMVDPDPAAEEVAGRFDVPLFKSVQEMFASHARPDAAIVCTPNHTHVAVSRQLLDGGLHVLVEKPISVDIPSGQELVAYASSLNLHLLVGHHRRFNRYIIATKHILGAGSLGRIIAFSGLWTTYKPPSYFDPPAAWRRSRTGGPILINLIHEIDVLHHLLGAITRVHAERALPQRGFDAEEGAAVVLRFASGAVGTFVLADAAPSPHNFEAGTGENPAIPRAGQDFYRIFGTQAALSVPDMRRWSYDGREKSWTAELREEVLPVPEDKPPFELQVRHFVSVVRGSEEPSCSGAEGLRAVVVCDAIKRALESGFVVDL